MADEDPAETRADGADRPTDERETDAPADANGPEADRATRHPDDEMNVDPDRHGERYTELVNAAVLGTVTLHGRERDIRVALDGASALRLLKIFEQRGDDGTLADPWTRTHRALSTHGWSPTSTSSSP
jgi:hypothetical protein